MSYHRVFHQYRTNPNHNMPINLHNKFHNFYLIAQERLHTTNLQVKISHQSLSLCSNHKQALIRHQYRRNLYRWHRWWVICNFLSLKVSLQTTHHLMKLSQVCLIEILLSNLISNLPKKNNQLIYVHAKMIHQKIQYALLQRQSALLKFNSKKYLQSNKFV
jgi:hypothetical protein